MKTVVLVATDVRGKERAQWLIEISRVYGSCFAPKVCLKHGDEREREISC
jgi:hypothetical protein